MKPVLTWKLLKNLGLFLAFQEWQSPISTDWCAFNTYYSQPSSPCQYSHQQWSLHSEKGIPNFTCYSRTQKHNIIQHSGKKWQDHWQFKQRNVSLVAKCSWLKCVLFLLKFTLQESVPLDGCPLKKKKRNKNIKALWLSLGKGNQKWQCCSAFFWPHTL